MKLQQYCIRKYRPQEIQHFFNIIYLWNRLSKNRKSLSDSALLKTIFIFRKKLFSQNIELLQYCVHGTIYAKAICNITYDENKIFLLGNNVPDLDIIFLYHFLIKSLI